jgi:hypothetical protein
MTKETRGAQPEHLANCIFARVGLEVTPEDGALAVSRSGSTEAEVQKAGT